MSESPSKARALPGLLARRPSQRAEFGAWFEELADALLGAAGLVVAGVAHRIKEVECYVHDPARHPDPFAHQEEAQASCGRWYFHRSSGTLRGGSFKGLDITCGLEHLHGGILLRTVYDPVEDRTINGCSLLVDHLMARTGHEHLRDLDAELSGYDGVLDTDSPVHLCMESREDLPEVLATARVGLTLKRAADHPEAMPAFLTQPYRFLTDPTIPKGKLHTVIALYQRGEEPDEIHRLAQSTERAVARYIEAFERGREQDPEEVERWFGRRLSNEDLAQLHGVLR